MGYKYSVFLCLNVENKKVPESFKKKGLKDSSLITFFLPTHRQLKQFIVTLFSMAGE